MSTLIQNLKISSVEEAEEILKSAGTEDLFEKAHQDGDMHPNGKWVWCASANGGKGDWRVAKKGSSSTSGGSGSAGNTGPSNTSSSYFSKLSNSLIEKYSKKKESVSLSDIEEFYEDFLRDRGQEPTRKAYANEAKKTYDAIVAKKMGWIKTGNQVSKKDIQISQNPNKGNDNYKLTLKNGNIEISAYSDDYTGKVPDGYSSSPNHSNAFRGYEITINANGKKTDYVNKDMKQFNSKTVVASKDVKQIMTDLANENR